MPTRLFFILSIALMSLWSITAQATTYTILVAPRDTAALTNAEAKQNGSTILSERKVYKALTKAAEVLNQPGAHEVR